MTINNANLSTPATNKCPACGVTFKLMGSIPSTIGMPPFSGEKYWPGHQFFLAAIKNLLMWGHPQKHVFHFLPWNSGFHCPLKSGRSIRISKTIHSTYEKHLQAWITRWHSNVNSFCIQTSVWKHTLWSYSFQTIGILSVKICFCSLQPNFFLMRRVNRTSKINYINGTFWKTFLQKILYCWNTAAA